MQYGINALGELVNLLNDGGLASLPPKPSPPHSTATLSSYSSAHDSTASSFLSSKVLRPTQAFSRKSSCSSNISDQSDDLDSPQYSPVLRPTPLLRFDSTSTQKSSSSSSSGALTPSPMTPVYSFDPLDQNKNIPQNQTDPFFRPIGPYFTTAQQQLQQQIPLPQQGNAIVAQPIQQLPQTSYLPLQAASTLLAFEDSYPLQPPAVQFAYATDLIQPTPPIALTSPTAATSRQSNNSTTNSSPAAGPKTAKKKYPCPHAVRYNCTDTFTTSGHAARHGKKHTGEKNIHCPTCNKAFTRKDNMKQHERTHRANRDQPSADTGSKRHSIKSDAPTNSEDVHMSDLDYDADIVEHVDGLAPKKRKTNSVSMMDSTTVQLRAGPPRPVMERTITGDSQDGDAESPGLDALAMAAGIS